MQNPQDTPPPASSTAETVNLDGLHTFGAESPLAVDPAHWEAELEKARAALSEQHEAWLRAKAETENMRRRAQEDVLKASKFAAEKFAQAMLPVKDSLEAALSNQTQTLETLREGVELTLKQLVSAFDTSGLVEENPIGHKFDPNRHQAIGMQEADQEPNTVLVVLQKGYLLNERVIRPAMVMVSKGRG
jgi:molecular chaperone GrpE